MTETKIIAIDDDPTGSQTVHSCLLLTRWDATTLVEALEDRSPLFFVLSNTRAMDASKAAAVTREICRNLKQALDDLASRGRNINPLIVSRSDSTLRGHYPVETDVIAEELGPFDAHFLTPGFFEAGRITRDSTHYLVVDGVPKPVHETEFARDSVFGFSTAFLPDYVEEKTGGRIRASQVQRFSLDDLRGDSRERLRTLAGNVCCVVDGEVQADFDRFAAQVQEVAGEGRRFLFRSAASLITSLAALPPQPVARGAMASYVRDGEPGVVIVGSHVRKTSDQLEYLFEDANVVPVAVDVRRLDGEEQAMRADVLGKVRSALARNAGAVVYTSRDEVVFDSQQARLAFGERVSAFLVDTVRGLPENLGFLISKGGITSNDVLSKGLELRKSRVVGQILTGCSVVLCPQDHPRYPRLPVVIFPGNVGGEAALAEVYAILTRQAEEQIPLASGRKA